MPVVRSADARRTETPNAVMTTFASPSLGRSTQALWRVEMAPGARGPEHAMDSEQVWTVLEGRAAVRVGSERHDVGAGDTVVLPPAVLREITADAELGLTAVVTGVGAAVASGPGRDPVVPPWIA